MIARKITPEEVKRGEELFSISFDSPYDCKETPLELYEKYINHPNSPEQEHPLEQFAAFEDDNTTMMSHFSMQPFELNFDDHTESMYSIGGVATLPQYRKRGGIRACFEKALPYLYEKEVVFSYLYPFSTAYYRKFGYELGCRKHLYKLALQHLPAFHTTGSCYLLDSSTADRASKDIPYLYGYWQKRYNMMVKENAYTFSFIPTANPYKDQIFTYVYVSEKGEPLGYMTFHNNTAWEQRHMECSSFFYINKEGLKGLLSLAATFASDYRYFSFFLPEGEELEQILPEWSFGAVEHRCVPNGMVRIINVRRALTDAAYLGSGSFTIKVSDSFIKENNQTFRVSFADGKCTKVSICEQDNSSADISLSIASLSALLTGACRTDAAFLFDDVQTTLSREALSQIFYQKPFYITTPF